MFIALVVVSCGGGGGGGDGDTTPPTADPMSPTGSPITTGQWIMIDFSEPMDEGSLVFGGDLTSEGDGGFLPGSDNSAVFVPSTQWSSGAGRTLTVDARDLAGNPMETLSLTYDVFTGPIYFVSSGSGADTNNGLTSITPKRTIMGAMNITSADSYSPVLVAGGNYIVDSGFNVATNVVMKRGVWIYGGWSSDFSDRDTTLNVSSIADLGTTIAADGGNQNRAVYVNINPLAIDTVIDGFSITGGSPASGTATGIYVAQGNVIIRNNIFDGGTGALNSIGIHSYFSSTTIEGNIIHGGTATDSTKGLWVVISNSTITGNTISGGSGSNESYGIHVVSASATIEDNDIDGGTGGSAVGIGSSDSSPVIERNTITGGDAIAATGIFASGGTPMIRNNAIDGGVGVDSTIGISLDATSPDVQNNTVDGGAAGGPSVGLNSWNSSPVVKNNILFTSGGSSRFCFREGNAASDPTSMDNNDLFDCSTALYQDEGSSNINSVTTINSFSDITASGNVSVNPVFVSVTDRHLTGSSPVAVIQGGMDLSGAFTTDRDGITRTAPWSIGAYERN